MTTSSPAFGGGAGGPHPEGSLAEQALANLVNQFARPLDFLRELAQNAIDAGSPRIDVSVSYRADPDPARPGVLRVAVDDYGEGMDEDVIDNQLTRLFSSSKERDLTKIGKFGIGFTSVFAIRPEAVLVRTGRHGEHWELLFHPDRTFEKIRLDEPVHGTSVTLFKRMAAAEVDAFVQEVRFVLGYWCEHSETPLSFRDLTRHGPASAEVAGDPFAAFAAPPAPPDRIDRPLALDAALQVHHQEPGVEVVIGVSSVPRYGFYNGGLTLLNTQNAEVLGPFARRLGHCAFKVKHDRLEHTLTRDNVLQDENWEHAMAAVLRACGLLRARVHAEIARAAQAGEPLGPWQAWLAADVRSVEIGMYPSALFGLPALRTVTGETAPLHAVRAQQARAGSVLLGNGDTALTAALRREGHLVLEDTPEARALLEACDEPPPFDFLRRPPPLRRAEELFVAPELLPAAALSAAERALVDRAEELLGFAVGIRVRVPGTDRVFQWAPGRETWLNRLAVRVGDFGGTALGRADVLALNGPASGDVFLRPEPAWFKLPAFVSWRTLLVNRHHPLFRAQLLASGEDLDLAAYGLASALLHVEGIEGDAAHQRMLAALFDEQGDR